MNLEIVCYSDLQNHSNHAISDRVTTALCNTGIIGVRNVPFFQEKSRAFVETARKFSALDEKIKQQYAPDRDAGITEGYELGAEWFKDQNGNMKIDDKKASFYAFVPDNPCNRWPREVDLKTPYLELGEIIFNTGKTLLNFLGVNETVDIHHDRLRGYGRMLHYHQGNNNANTNPDWCGAHFDHGLFTGLMPAYYFQNGKEVCEPTEAGLFIFPSRGKNFEKVNVPDQSILLFQVGEFSQLVSNDKIRATKHLVKRANGNMERYALAIFYTPDANAVICSQSELAKDARYTNNSSPDGSIVYDKWDKSSYARYRAM